MSFKGLLAPLALAASAFALASCSGLKNNTPCTDCTPTGNATLSMSIYDAPPTGVTLLDYPLPIIGISLTSSTGQVSVFSPSTAANVELTRLQTDSSLLVAGASVTPGSYTAVNITVASSSGIYVNSSSAALGACPANAVCGTPTAAATTITYTFPSALTLTANQSSWVGLNFNLSNAIGTSNGAITVNFGNTGVLTATTTPRTGIPTGVSDTIEDFSGVVTAYTANSSITVQNGVSGQSITAVLNSSTEYDTPNAAYSACAASPSCLVVGSTVSMNLNLAAAGTLTATEVDVLDATAVDEFEGVIYPTATAGIYGMILSDRVNKSGNTSVAGAGFGSGVNLTISQTATYSIDTGILSSAIPTPVGFASASDILAGQQVRVQISAATTGSDGLISATASQVLLRNSRVTATIDQPGILFTLANTPAFMGFVTEPQVQTYQNFTLFDGVTDATGLTAGQNVSIRALYLNAAPTFLASKVRTH